MPRKGDGDYGYRKRPDPEGKTVPGGQRKDPRTRHVPGEPPPGTHDHPAGPPQSRVGSPLRLEARRLDQMGKGAIGGEVVIEFNIDGGGGIILPGDKMELVFPGFNFMLVSWQLIVKPAATCVLDLWMKEYAAGLPTVADTIIGLAADKPQLTAAVENRSLITDTWIPKILAGSKITLNVDSNDLADRICLGLSGRKA